MNKRIWIAGIIVVVLLAATGTAIAYYSEDIFPSADRVSSPLKRRQNCIRLKVSWRGG